MLGGGGASRNSAPPCNNTQVVNVTRLCLTNESNKSTMLLQSVNVLNLMLAVLIHNLQLGDLNIADTTLKTSTTQYYVQYVVRTCQLSEWLHTAILPLLWSGSFVSSQAA